MYYFLFILIIIAFTVIIYILSRHFRELQSPENKKSRKIANIKTEITRQARQDEVKNKLLEKKLKKIFIKKYHIFVDKLNSALRSLQKSKRLKRASKFRFAKKLKNIFKLLTKTAQRVIAKFEHKKTLVDDVFLEDGAVGSSDEIDIANKLLEKNKTEEAESIFIEVLKKDPKNIDAYMGLGKIYSLTGDIETAEEAYRYIIKIDPKYHAGHKELCNFYAQQKKWQELIQLCEELEKEEENHEWMYEQMGIAHKRRGYPEKAEECFRKAVELSPKNERLLDYLFEVAIINKNKSLAEKCLNTIVSINPDEVKLQDCQNKIDTL